MQIESVRLKNFKSFQKAEMLDLPNFCVIVGANGSGKSILFDVFSFLRNCLTYNVRQALQVRGGFNEVISRGASEYDEIEIELRFRMETGSVNPFVTYKVSIGILDKKPVVTREILRYERSRHASSFPVLDFAFGTGFAITNEEDFDKPDEDLRREEHSVEKDVLAIKGLGQFERFNAVCAVRRFIEHWHVSDFQISQARGSKDATGYADHLSITGENLQLVARNIFENHPKVFDAIVKATKRHVPGITNVEPVPTQDGRLLLSFQDSTFTNPYIDKYVSDGAIKIFAYLVLLYDPEPHPLLCAEHPENQLYPKLRSELAEEFRSYGIRGGQVIVSTHSPDFLNAVELDEVFWLVKSDGFTTIKRAKENKQISNFMVNGDQMGYLWKEGYFTGADPQ